MTAPDHLHHNQKTPATKAPPTHETKPAFDWIEDKQ
jgi:hypothetical protein